MRQAPFVHQLTAERHALGLLSALVEGAVDRKV